MGNHSRSYLTCLKSDAIATRKYQNGSTVAAYSPIYRKTDDHWLFTFLSIRCTSTPGQERNAAWSLCKGIDNTEFVTATRIKNQSLLDCFTRVKLAHPKSRIPAGPGRRSVPFLPSCQRTLPALDAERPLDQLASLQTACHELLRYWSSVVDA